MYNMWFQVVNVDVGRVIRLVIQNPDTTRWNFEWYILNPLIRFHYRIRIIFYIRWRQWTSISSTKSFSSVNIYQPKSFRNNTESYLKCEILH